MARGDEKFRPPDPEWERLGQRSPLPTVQLGDPTRWGARVETVMPNVGIAPATVDVKQVVLAQTTDRFSRPWVLAGSIVMNRTDWDRSPAPGAYDIDVFLDFQIGVGQASLTQRMSARRLVEVATGSLFPTPSANPGVYLPQTDGDRLSYPFYIAGIVGRTVNVSATFFVFTPAAVINPRVAITLVMSPYNAGTGL